MDKSVFENPLSEAVYSERVSSRTENLRGPYFRDQTAIIHSLPFRRLKHKAQVFFSPNNDHVCTRIEHALHVATIAATVAKGLDLNEDMAYAIGLAHDLGQAPFGHAGESVLNEKTGRFIHEIHGLRIVDKLGNRGRSLNLTYGVRDGIICHCGEALDQEIRPRQEEIDLATITDRSFFPSSYEGCVARMADRIAYLGRDLEDAIYGGFIEVKKMPGVIRNELGGTNGEIIDCLVIDVVETSKKKGTISVSDEKYDVLRTLSQFSFDNIYRHQAILRYKRYCKHIVESLFKHPVEIYSNWNLDLDKYKESPVPLDQRFGRYLGYMQNLYEGEKSSAKLIACDYVAGMTDSYALRCVKEISFPEELSFDKPNMQQLR